VSEKPSTMTTQLFRLKDLTRILAESHAPGHTLKKALGAWELLLLGIGVIIGAGIFTTVGTAAAGDLARPGAGPALMISFVITAVVCGFAALCYAELAALVPISGSAYTYAYATFGELIAWIIGWDLILEYCVGTIAVSVSWSGYFAEFLRGFGLSLPPWASVDYRSAMHGFLEASKLVQNGLDPAQLTPALHTAWTAVQGAPHLFGLALILNLPALLIVLLLTFILILGIKESARFNMVIVGIKLLVIAFFVILGARFVKPEHWAPFAPNGFTGIKAGAAIVFFAYIGFDVVSTVAEETRHPKRDLPIGIIGSLAVCTVIYIIVAAVFTGLMPVSLLRTTLAHGKTEPLAAALQYVHQDWAVGIVALGAIVAQTAVMLVLILGQSRVFFSMARDGLLPPSFAKVHPRFKTPYVTTLVVGVVAALIAAMVNIDEMVDLTNIGTLFAFTLVCLGVIILRIKEPHRPRPFKVPFSPLVPLAGAGFCIFLMTALPALTWIRFFVWMALGLVIYFSYSRLNSELHKS
jgi:basic amino acid/polyamine antiporter, APA family